MAEAATDYHHGDQDPAANIATWRTFMALAKWSALLIGVLIVVLTLWFCVGENFLGGLIPGLVIFALGAWFLRSKPASGH